MSIEDERVIDFISLSPDGIFVTLTATDHLQWGSREHLMLIQEKLNAYLAFIESGEIFDTFPKANGKQIKLEVVCKYEPDDDGKGFFALCEKAILKSGFSFGYRIHETESGAS